MSKEVSILIPWGSILISLILEIWIDNRGKVLLPIKTYPYYENRLGDSRQHLDRRERITGVRKARVVEVLFITFKTAHD